MTDIGKRAKQNGKQHPNVLRRIDPVPLRATPTAKPHRKISKPFGYAYETTWPKFVAGGIQWVWTARTRWFATERQRDQALETIIRKASKCERNYEKVRRE